MRPERDRQVRAMTMTFRVTLTAVVMLIISTLAASLLFLQFRTANLATEEAATSAMDAASLRTLSLLEGEIVNLSKVVRTLSAAPSLADSSERSEVGRGIDLLKDILLQWPGTDSIYVGYDNGSWLQVQRLEGMDAEQRERLHAPANAAFAIALIRPTATGELPTRRVFEDRDGNQIAQFDIWRRGYDARKRGWYINASKTEQLAISQPYLSFSLAVPMVTISAPLQGRVQGVVGLDLKLDSYSKSAGFLRFSKKGTAAVFTGDGKPYRSSGLQRDVCAHDDRSAVRAASACRRSSGLAREGGAGGLAQDRTRSRQDSAPTARTITSGSRARC